MLQSVSHEASTTVIYPQLITFARFARFAYNSQLYSHIPIIPISQFDSQFYSYKPLMSPTGNPSILMFQIYKPLIHVSRKSMTVPRDSP